MTGSRTGSRPGKKNPHRNSKRSDEGSGESEKVTRANNKLKGAASLVLQRNWCDVVRAALGTRRIGDEILLERYDFGTGAEPLLVATGLKEEEEEEKEEEEK